MPHIKAPFDEIIIREYLSDNPDFFNRHPELLLSMRVPHIHHGAISLVERQQQQLREKVVQLEEEITCLLATAAHNEKIYLFNTELSLKLLNCPDLGSLKEVLEDSLKQQFNFSHVRLISVHDVDTELSTLWHQRLARGYYFGRLTHKEAQRLFGSQVGSVALTRLSDIQANQVIFAIASPDGTHFHPEMDNTLLEQLRQLLANMLSKL